MYGNLIPDKISNESLENSAGLQTVDKQGEEGAQIIVVNMSPHTSVRVDNICRGL